MDSLGIVTILCVTFIIITLIISCIFIYLRSSKPLNKESGGNK